MWEPLTALGRPGTPKRPISRPGARAGGGGGFGFKPAGRGSLIEPVILMGIAMAVLAGGK